MQCAGSCGQGTTQATLRHPCYSADGHKQFARMHLPVAPKCNISCNYCNRRYDCVNESRPGVTSEVLTPDAALAKFKLVNDIIDNLFVVGIAGPGDALADWEKTKTSLSLIKAEKSDIIFCLSTNGLLLPDLCGEIVALGIRHVTVTVNCVDPTVGARIYRKVTYNGCSYAGEEGAALLLKNQLAGIKKLVEHDVLVKINIVMMNGINDNHIPKVVETVKGLGVLVTNIMPLIPAPGSALENHPQTSKKDLDVMRSVCELQLPQMRHCQQCRADAIGLLHEDRSAEFRTVSGTTKVDSSFEKPYKIAVASKYGKMVDLHFGHAAEFTICSVGPDGFAVLEKRAVEQYCQGVIECAEEDNRRAGILQALSDCDAVLTMRIGYQAKKRLETHGILSVENCDTVENGLIFALQELKNRKSA